MYLCDVLVCATKTKVLTILIILRNLVKIIGCPELSNKVSP